MKRYYMACLDLEGRSVLVVGGGRIAHEKASGLLESGARVTVVAPEISTAVRALPVELVERRFADADVEGRFLVVGATADAEVNRSVSEAANARAVLCNAVDMPELCSVILPAVHREGPIAIAVSTGGASPALAQRIRDEIAQVVGPEHSELARRLLALRPWAKRHLPTYEERRDYFSRLVERALG